MTGKTQSLVNQIRTKVISRITKQPEFKNADAVIEAAVINFYNQLKRNKEL